VLPHGLSVPTGGAIVAKRKADDLGCEENMGQRTILVGLVALVLLTAPFYPSFGERAWGRNEVELWQGGNNNEAYISQAWQAAGIGDFGPDELNMVRGRQDGEESLLVVEQLGMGNLVIVSQAGAAQWAAIEQIGAGNLVDLRQEGFANQALVYQEGAANRANLMQTGSHHLLDLRQLGHGNICTIVQSGGGNTATITQISF
jgi:minor curlin subunit